MDFGDWTAALTTAAAVSGGLGSLASANDLDDPPPSPERRALMARIGSKDTAPELVVRRLLHAMGYRYRLHRKHLPGTPDICFASRKKAIFVHGCFWHRHDGCRRATTPSARKSYWEEKFRRNVVRDRRNLTDLGDLGWDVLVVWECETADLPALASRLAGFLSGSRSEARLQRLGARLRGEARA